MRWLIILGILIFCALYAAIATTYRGFKLNRNKEEESELELEFVLDEYMLRHETIDQQKYCTIHFESGELLSREGYAELPFLHSFFDLPAVGNFSAKVVSSEYKDYNLNHPMLPGRGEKNKGEKPEIFPFSIDPSSVEDKWYPGPLSHITTPFIQNGQRGADLYLYPFQYNSVNQVLRVHEKVRVRLVAEDMEKESRSNSLYLNRGSLNDMIYRSTFFNRYFDRSIHPFTMNRTKEILIIHSKEDAEKVKPYIEWKKEKGFHVQTQKENKGIRVKDIIAQAFEANENLSYVQLVGDWGDIKSEKRASQYSPVAPLLDPSMKSDEENYALHWKGETTPKLPSPHAEIDPFDFDEKALDDDSFSDIIIDASQIPNTSKVFFSSKIEEEKHLFELVEHQNSASEKDPILKKSSSLFFPPTNIRKEKPPILFSISCYSGIIEKEKESQEISREVHMKIEKPPLAMVTQPWLPVFGITDKMECLLEEFKDDLDLFDETYATQPHEKGFDSTLYLAAQVSDRVVFEPERDRKEKVLKETKRDQSISSAVIRKNVKILHATVMESKPFPVCIKGENGELIPEVLVVLSQNKHHFSGMTNSEGKTLIRHDLKPGQALLSASGLAIVSEQQKIFVKPSVQGKITDRQSK